MTNKKRTYRELKTELDDLMSWFEHGDIDVDEALQKHAEATKLLAELEAYLEQTEQKITQVK
jgi:exodeoxyribonuclease VII small subunit